MSFAIDQLVADCQAAIAEDQPALAVRDVLRRTLERPGDVAEAFGPKEGGLNLIHVSPELTVLHVTWAPGMRLYPHNHEMWAVIGIYGGQEDNTFYRRDGGTLVESGGQGPERAGRARAGRRRHPRRGQPAPAPDRRHPRLRRRLREPAQEPVAAGNDG